MAAFAKSTFSHATYAAIRPSYPQSLYDTVLSFHQGSRNLCVDLGCGHGVVTRQLAPSFKQIIGTDPSKGMIQQAQNSTPKERYANVEFRDASCEDMPFLERDSVDAVVAGQAAHWFHHAKLFKELSRVVRKGGSLAFWGYKDYDFVDYPKATEILYRYTCGTTENTLGPYWSQPGRSIVQHRYRDIKPPGGEWEAITRLEYEPGKNGPGTGRGTMFLSKKSTIAQCREYVRTWSSYHGWQQAHQDMVPRNKGGKGDMADVMFDEIAGVEPELANEEREVEVEWGTGLVMARKT